MSFDERRVSILPGALIVLLLWASASATPTTPRVSTYTTGEVTGRLPLLGWVTALSWQREPEVARRQGDVWRLVGFQD